MTWPTKRQRQRQRRRQWQRQIQWQRQRQLQIHLENTLKEGPQRLVTFETFDQSDEETWPDQNRQWQWQWQWQWYLENTLKDQSSRLVTFETLITFMTIENNNLNIHSVPWIKSDRDSIRNSCDVFLLSLISLLLYDMLVCWICFRISCMVDQKSPRPNKSWSVPELNPVPCCLLFAQILLHKPGHKPNELSQGRSLRKG